MPVVAPVECGSQLSWRSHVCIAVQSMANLVRIFLVDTRECQIRESLSSLDVKTGGSRWGLSTHKVRHNDEEDSIKRGLHRVATLNEMSGGLKLFPAENNVYKAAICSHPSRYVITKPRSSTTISAENPVSLSRVSLS